MPNYLVAIEEMPEKSEFILDVEVDGQILRFKAKIDNYSDIRGVSLSPALFELLTGSASREAPQTLIRAVLDWDTGIYSSLPVVLSE
jgi:hypothetical protein